MKTQLTTPKSILFNTVQEDIPQDEIDLWPAISRAIVTNSIAGREAPATFSPHSNRLRGLRVGGAVALSLLALIAIFTLTPQSDLLADAMRNLFNPITSEQLPKPSTEDLATPTVAPSFAVELAPAVEPVTANAPTNATLHPCEQNMLGYGCKVAKAEARAGFDAQEFSRDLPALAFQDVAVDSAGTVSIEYIVIGGGGYLYLNQGLGDEFPPYSGNVPESAIQSVWVDEHRGEYVEGMWAAGGDDLEYTWNECCAARLRWMDEERWYEINKLSAMPQTDYLTREVLIELAASLVNQPESDGTPRLEYLNLEDAADLVDFTLSRPSILPEEFFFGHADYDPESGRLRLNYYPGGDAILPGSAHLSIVEIPLEKFATNSQGEELLVNGEEVDINGFSGQYTSSDAGNHWLTWRTEELEITLAIISSEHYGGDFTKSQVLEIARGIK